MIVANLSLKENMHDILPAELDYVSWPDDLNVSFPPPTGVAGDPPSSPDERGGQDVGVAEPSPIIFVLAGLFLCSMIFLVLYICADRPRPLHTETEEERERRLEGRREARRKRAAYVEEHLKVKPWASDDSSTAASSAEGSSELVRCELQSSATDNSSTADVETGDVANDEECDFNFDDHIGCAICMSNFVEGELVCQSSNIHCQHVYHKECMASWLMKHKECPMCREDYLLEEDPQSADAKADTRRPQIDGAMVFWGV